MLKGKQLLTSILWLEEIDAGKDDQGGTRREWQELWHCALVVRCEGLKVMLRGGSQVIDRLVERSVC